MVASPDTTAPTTTDDAPADWQNDPVTVHLTATDNAGGWGVAHTYYKLDGAGTFSEGAQVDVLAPLDHSNDGAHTIKYYSVDKAGNTEGTETCTVMIDTTDPVITGVVPVDGAVYYQNGSGDKVAWTSSDQPFGAASACSGVDSEEATIDDVPVDLGASINSLDLGSHEFDLTVTDGAGNQAVISTTFDVEAAGANAPTTVDDAPDGWQNQPVTVHFTAYRQRRSRRRLDLVQHRQPGDVDAGHELHDRRPGVGRKRRREDHLLLLQGHGRTLRGDQELHRRDRRHGSQGHRHHTGR